MPLLLYLARFRLAIFISGLLPIVSAQGSDLLEIYDLAKANDPEIAAQRYLYQAELTRVDQSRAAFKPQLELGAGGGLERDAIDSGSVDADDTYGTANANLVLDQQIYNRANRITVEQSEQSAKQAEILLRDAEQDLVVRVAGAYFSVLAAEDNLDLAVSEKRSISRQLELARERLEVGLGTNTDLFEAQARFKLSEADEIQARNTINQAQLSLAELIGRLPDALERLNLNHQLTVPQPENVEFWANSAVGGNLDILAAQYDVDLSRRDIDREQAGNGLTLGLNLRHNYNYDDGGINQVSDLHSNRTSAMINLRLPFYQGGLIRARTQEASERFHASEQRLEGIERTANSQARQSYLDVISTVSQVRALEQAVTASESALDAKEEGFKAGINTNIEVLDAQRDLFFAKRDHLQARYNYILNALRLQLAIGDLDVEDLRTYNDWLE